LATEHGSGFTATHAKKVKENGIANSICKSKVTSDTFSELRKTHQVLNYQLSLNLFHLGDPAFTTPSYDDTLVNHLLNARTTFIELPESMDYTGNEVDKILNLAAKHNFNAKVKTLGAVFHDDDTVCTMLRVDIMDFPPHTNKEILFDTYKCSPVVGGA